MNDQLKRLLPNKINQWSIAEQDQFYNSENLYEYINGGAELFLSYGFKHMITRIYTTPDQPEIIVDVFDMGNSYNAYGVFSYSREQEDSTFGQGSQYVTGLLLFWKNQYYISILFNPETEEAKMTAFEIARHIESKIPAEGPLPKILNLLQQEGLKKETIRYFRHHIWMNTYQFISNENILNINDSTNAILAKYTEKDDNLIFLLIKYASNMNAIIARDQFIKAYLPELSNSGIAQKEEKWIGCRTDNKILMIVFNAPNRASIEKIIQR
jgi:hypothetical protein